MRDELRDAWRGLRAAPGTSLLAVAILTVGIAASTVTFSVVDTVALRRLPVPDPSSLVAIGRLDRVSAGLGTIAPQDFYTWQEQVPAFAGVAASGPWSLTYGPAGSTKQLTALRITPNLFDVLRVPPALGNAFTSVNEQAGQDKVAILSHAFWMRAFGGDTGVLGRQVTFGKETREIVGVMPPGFTFPVGPERPTDVWIPIVPRATDHDHGVGGRTYFMQVVARLQPGATVEQAQQQVSAATDAVVAAYPEQSFWKDTRPVVLSLHDFVVGPAQGWLVLVLGAVALVLVVAYVNVANLLLARATVRARELAVRTALGANRLRLARMLVIEGLLLSLGAATLGIIAATWGLSIATASLPAGLARASSIALDGRVLAVAIGAATMTGLLFSAIPAWHGARADVMTVMKEGATIGAGRARWQRALLVSEVAFVVTLVVASALFVTSFVNVLRTDLGFARGHLLGFRVSKPLATASTDDRSAAAAVFGTDLLDRVAAVPGVQGAALVDGALPLFGPGSSYSIEVEGYGQTTGADMVVLRSVTPGYFDVTGIQFVEGRTFADAGRPGAPAVAILNEEAAHRFFGGRSPIGETVRFRGPTTIVGVVRNVRVLGPEVDVRPEMYVPLWQELSASRGGTLSVDLITRLAPPPAGSVAAVQDAVTTLTNGPPATVRDLDERFRALTAGRRFNAGLMTVFGVLALAIGAVGVYGLMSFVVAQETRAIGVRMALGASTGRIFRRVLSDSGRLVAFGTALGLVGGWWASRLFHSVVFGVTGHEPWLYAVVGLVVSLVGGAAAVVPAWRASRVDPLVALRME